jgi:hypothetical protein
MKILLQDVRSGLYFCAEDVWTANPDTAFDFQHAKWLREFVAKHHLHEVQMVVKFNNPDTCEVVSLQSPVFRQWPRMEA